MKLLKAASVNDVVFMIITASPVFKEEEHTENVPNAS